MSPDREHPPRGWYADPAHPARERYWDGARWTQVVRHHEVIEARPGVHDLADPANRARGPRPGPAKDPALDLPLAGWWRRFGSGVADIVVAWALTAAMLLLTASDFLLHYRDESIAYATTVLQTGVIGEVPQTLDAQTTLLSTVVTAVTAAYTIIFLGLWGATPGQRLCGLRVVRAPLPPAVAATLPSPPKFTVARPGWMRSVSKGLGWALFSTGPVFLIAQLLNALLPLWHPRKQSLTDLLAATLVIRDTGALPEVRSGESAE